MTKLFGLVGLVGITLITGACSDREVVDQTSSTVTTLPSSTSTSTLGPTTTTTVAGQGLDLSDVAWVTHGPEGIRLDAGPVIWVTQPFPTGIARDHQGGFVFTDSTGLWWFQRGSAEPEMVGEGADELLSVAATPSGPVALVWGAGPGFYGLADGEPVDAPTDASVEVSSEPPWFKWTAANGLSAWVTDPKVETDSEGQPSQVLDPAHLVVGEGEEVIVDVAIADSDEAWATIHDFDGRRLIISRGPYEPAMPVESFVLVDLSTGEMTVIFEAGGTRATFTGPDTDWSGPVLPPDLSD